MRKTNKFDKWLQEKVTIKVPKMNMVPLVLGGAAAVAGIVLACKMNKAADTVEETESTESSNDEMVDVEFEEVTDTTE